MTASAKVLGATTASIAFLVLVSCEASGSHGDDARSRGLESRVASLEGKLAALQALHNGVRSDVGLLQTKVEILEDDEGVVDPAVKSYVLVKTQFGPLMVVAENVVPYGDGQKVTLRIGNPHAVKFEGFKAKIRYGLRYPTRGPDTQKWLAEYNAWEASIREKEVTLTDALGPGKWNRVSVILAPAKPEEVAYLGIRMTVDNVSMWSL